jgi:hypothetical protein
MGQDAERVVAGEESGDQQDGAIRTALEPDPAPYRASQQGRSLQAHEAFAPQRRDVREGEAAVHGGGVPEKPIGYALSMVGYRPDELEPPAGMAQ